MNRVAITGMGVSTPLGNYWGEVLPRLKTFASATKTVDWGMKNLYVKQLCPREPMHPLSRWEDYPPVARLAAETTAHALADAFCATTGFTEVKPLRKLDVGIAYGTSLGEEEASLELGLALANADADYIDSQTYLKAMPHGTAAVLAQTFGIGGRMYNTSVACSSASQAIGYAYEAIRNGEHTYMLAGGTDVIGKTFPCIFDKLRAASTGRPDAGTPAPFSAKANGIVLGEGSATFVLEEMNHAIRRGATIYAEVVGFGTATAWKHPTRPDKDAMKTAINKAMCDANGYQPDFISAHATGTAVGDAVESNALYDLFGDKIPVSAFKSYTGHTLSACGGIESWLAINMMRDGWFAPTLNLKEPSSSCAPLQYITDEGREIMAQFVMVNNSGFGGVNTSLMFARI